MSRFMRLSSMAIGDWSSSLSGSMLGRRAPDIRRVGVILVVLTVASAASVAAAADGGGVADRLPVPAPDPGGDGVMGAVDAGEGGTAGLLSIGGGRRAPPLPPGSLTPRAAARSSSYSAAAASWSPKSTVHMSRGGRST